MDAVGYCCFMCAACNGGILHRLANLGGQSSRHCNADTQIRDYELGARRHSMRSRQSWMETADTQLGHTVGDSGQRDLFSYFANCRTEANLARHLYRESTLRALLNLGNRWGIV